MADAARVGMWDDDYAPFDELPIIPPPFGPNDETREDLPVITEAMLEANEAGFDLDEMVANVVQDEEYRALAEFLDGAVTDLIASRAEANRSWARGEDD
jgi:hypothetical protein